MCVQRQRRERFKNHKYEMNAKKITEWIAVVLVSLALLAACGDQREAVSDSPEPKPGTEVNTQTDVPAETEPSETDSESPTEEPEPAEVSGHLHPLISKKYKNYFNADGYRLIDTSWDVIELDEEEAREYPALAAALTELFEADESGMARDAEDNLEYAEDFRMNSDPESDISFEMSREVTLQRCDTDIISFTVLDFEYSGGAHGMYGYGGYNYDVKTGRRLLAKDVFEDTENLAGIIRDKLISMYEPDTFPSPEQTLEYIGECVKDDSLSFVLTNSGARVYFNPYEIADYAAGAFMVDLYPEDYPGLMKPVYEKTPENWIAGLGQNETINVDIDGDKIAESVSYAEDVDSYWEGDNYYSEIRGFTVYAGGEELYVSVHSYSTDALLLREEDKSCLYIMCLSENDYISLYVVDITGGKPRLVTDEYGINARRTTKDWDWNSDDNISSGYTREFALTDPENMMFESRTELLGTVDGRRMMHVGEDGTPQPNEGWEAYRICNDNYVYTALQEITGILLDDSGKETSDFTIPKGESVTYVATDNLTFGDVEMSDGKRVRLYVGKEDYYYTINGIDLFDLFDGILFAG